MECNEAKFALFKEGPAIMEVKSMEKDCRRLNLDRSIDNLARRLDRFDPVLDFSNKTGLNYWKGKPIIPLEEWLGIRETPYVIDYFPNDFDQVITYIPENEVEHTKKPNYGKLKCFHCLLSPDDDPSL
jgi:hypothetical protein